MPEIQNTENGRRVVMPTNDARQGVTGHNVRWVLAFGLGGAILFVVGVAVVFMVAT